MARRGARGYRRGVIPGHQTHDEWRAAEDLRRRNAYLAALHETSVALIERLDVGEVLQSIVTRAASLVGTEHGYLYLPVDGATALENHVGIGFFARYVGSRVRPGEGLSGRVWESGEPLVVDDYRAWMGRSPRFEQDEVRAVVGVPLASARGVAGVIGLAHLEEGRTFGAGEVELLSRFAELASIALDNARLYEAERRRARELELLHRVRTAAARELDPPALFRTVVEAIAENYGYTQVSLYLRRGDVLHLQHQVGYDAVIERISVGQGVSGRVMTTGRGELLEDVRSDPAFLGAIAGIVSEVCVPLFDEGRVVGTLNVESTLGVRLTPEDLRLIAGLGEYVGMTIHRARLHSRVRESEQRLRTVVGNAPMVLFAWDAGGTFVLEEGSGLEQLGARPGEVVGLSVFELHAGRPDLLANARRALAGEAMTAEEEIDGVVFQTRYSPLRGEEGAVTGVIGVAVDITERKRLERELAHRAFHDPLTDLPNRALLFDRTAHALARSARSGDGLALLFVDLDDFKGVNDRLGHAAGDRLLVEVAERLRSCLRPGDTVARLAGDEFVLLLEGVDGIAGAEAVARRVLERLLSAFVVEGQTVCAGASIGVVLAGRAFREPDDLLRAADCAMYRAKRGGKGRYEVHDPAQDGSRRQAPRIVQTPDRVGLPSPPGDCRRR